jgi:hypothetical protein
LHALANKNIIDGTLASVTSSNLVESHSGPVFLKIQDANATGHSLLDDFLNVSTGRLSGAGLDGDIPLWLARILDAIGSGVEVFLAVGRVDKEHLCFRFSGSEDEFLNDTAPDEGSNVLQAGIRGKIAQLDTTNLEAYEDLLADKLAALDENLTYLHDQP